MKKSPWLVQDRRFKLSLQDVWMITTDSNQNSITHISPTPSNLKK